MNQNYVHLTTISVDSKYQIALSSIQQFWRWKRNGWMNMTSSDCIYFV